MFLYGEIFVLIIVREVRISSEVEEPFFDAEMPREGGAFSYTQKVNNGRNREENTHRRLRGEGHLSYEARGRKKLK